MQKIGRDLIAPEEVRMLDNNNAILFIRGERPVIDQKYDLMKHPNIGLTEDGGAEPYIHGKAKEAAFTISLATDVAFNDETGVVTDIDIAAAAGDYVLMAESDVFKETEEANQNEQQEEE